MACTLSFAMSACGGAAADASDTPTTTMPSASTTTSTTASTTAPNATGTSATDIAYASVSSAQKLDVYMPYGNGPFPAVVLIHGGAFMIGDKGGEAANAKVLTDNGYVAVSINYRLSGEAQFPAQVFTDNG